MQPSSERRGNGLLRRVREFMDKEYREIQRARRDADRIWSGIELISPSTSQQLLSSWNSLNFKPRFRLRQFQSRWLASLVLLLLFCGLRMYYSETDGCSVAEGSTSCHYSEEYDDLPPFSPDDGRTAPSLHQLWQMLSLQETTAGDPLLPINIEKNIFFHVTNCQQDLTPRQACSVEAAARAHPEWDVFVLFSAPTQVTELGKSGVVFSIKLENVKLSRIHILSYLNHQNPRSNMISKSKYPYTHTLDILRFATLLHRGGICLDLDVLVTKPLEGGNFAVKRSSSLVSPSILGLSDDKLGRSIAEEANRRMAQSYDWRDVDSASHFLTTLLETFVCNVSAVNMTDEQCQGFRVYDLDYAHPVPWPMAGEYFSPGSLENMQSDRTHAHTLWHRQLKCKQPEYGSPFHTLARYYCPNIFQKFPEHFGGKVSNTSPNHGAD